MRPWGRRSRGWPDASVVTRGSQGKEHNAPFDALVKASSANALEAESLYDVGLIQ